MDKIYKTIFLFLAVLILVPDLKSQTIKILPEQNIQTSSVIARQRVRLLSPNMGAWFNNTGIFNQDTRTNNTPGLEWPLGSGKFACFTAGLSISAFINGQLAQVAASYSGEYTPGVIVNDTGFTNSDFKVYIVKFDDNAWNNPDYANWHKMVPYGAPFDDVNNNGIFDPGIDKPGVKNSYQTSFAALTDAFVEQRNAGEGFGGGVTGTLLLADVRWTSWTYNIPGFEDVQFIEWKIINQSSNKVWERTRLAIFSDPDIGDHSNDYVGCDTVLNIGYCYNGTPNDGTGSGNTYGQYPPAFGFKVLRGPIDKVTNIDQSFTSFVKIFGSGGAPLPCEADANGNPLGAYNFMSGFKRDSTQWINPLTWEPTKFIYPGDPESGTGWTEFTGSVRNCNRQITGPTLPENFPSERRFLMGHGKDNFKILPGDTQVFVIAQMVKRGADHKNSVTVLKNYGIAMQHYFDTGFNLVDILPAPKVKSSITHVSQNECEINLLWDDLAESFKYHDTLFFPKADSNIYEFEGYEIYELNKNSNNIPDFRLPVTINTNDIQLVAIYDKRNNIGYIIDTLFTGVGNEYSPLPIVPPFGFYKPEKFPNFGLNRSQTIKQTAFPENYGGTEKIQYNQEYNFIVTAYAVSKSGKITRGHKVIRSNMNDKVIRVRPLKPGNSEFTYKNWDTLSTNRLDLGVTPVVLGQEYLKDATYKVVYDTPDTTYSILRSTNNGNSFETIKTNLKYTNPFSKVQDSSRIIDGVYIDVKRIIYRGVLRDPVFPDSLLQTRNYGWSYHPEQNIFVRGANRFRQFFYQSRSMSLVYPMAQWYTNVGSGLPAEELEIVKIVFDNSNGQTAYRYRSDTTQALFDNYYLYDRMINVPLRVYSRNQSTGVERQVNIAIVNSYDPNANPRMQFGFNPTADSLGGKVLLYIFKSDYNSQPDSFYTSKNLFLSFHVDLQYVWAPRLISHGSAPVSGDSLKIYPYTVTRPGVSYEFSTTAPYIDFDSNQTVIPRTYFLSQNYPNPFNPTTKIKFTIPEPTVLSLKIYNILGQLVNTIINETLYQPGETIVDFNGSGLASGVYFYVLQSKNFVESKKMVLIR